LQAKRAAALAQAAQGELWHSVAELHCNSFVAERQAAAAKSQRALAGICDWDDDN
jgi:hypothetical protein